MVCPSCHQTIQDGATFCDQCGASITSGAPAPAPQQFAPTPTPAVGGSVCPSCNTPFLPGTAFCDNCGAQLPAAGAPPPQFPPAQPQPFPQPQQPFPPQQQVFPQPGGFPPPAPVGPPPGARLMINGQNVPIPQKAEVLIGRSDAASQMFPDVDLTPFGGSPQTGVSRQHAKLTWQNAWMLEDMNSTNGTTLRGQKLAPHQKTPVNNGDPIVIGTLQLTFFAN